MRDKWFKFDPRCYHAVEPIKGGRRVSIALFSPRAWKRIPPHALCKLQDLGFLGTLQTHPENDLSAWVGPLVNEGPAWPRDSLCERQRLHHRAKVELLMTFSTNLDLPIQALLTASDIPLQCQHQKAVTVFPLHSRYAIRPSQDQICNAPEQTRGFFLKLRASLQPTHGA